MAFKVKNMKKRGIKGITTTISVVIAIVTLIVGVVVGMMVQAYTGVIAPPVGLTGEVKIGSLQPLSGDLETYGHNSRVAIDMAAEEVNEFLKKAGAGWTLKILTEDSETKAVVALTKLESLHAKGVKFVLGPMSSAEVDHIKEYGDANEILVISQSSTRPGLNAPGDFLFRFCPTDLIQGPALARLMTDDGITRVVAVYREDAWGIGLHDATKARFVELGGTFVKSIKYDPEAPEFGPLAAIVNTEVTSAIATHGAAKVGVLYIAFEEVMAVFPAFSAYNQSGWGVKWYGSDGTVQSSKMVNVTAYGTTVPEFSYQTKFINPIFAPTVSEKYQKVYDEVQDKLGRAPDSYAYAAYDMVWAVAYSLMTVDKYDSKAVRDVLPDVTASLFGASGWVILNEDGDRAASDYELWIIDKVDTTYEWKYVGKYIQATDSVVRE
jgi:branched-chain amino acid transport system substrate-binding protein